MPLVTLEEMARREQQALQPASQAQRVWVVVGASEGDGTPYGVYASKERALAYILDWTQDADEFAGDSPKVCADEYGNVYVDGNLEYWIGETHFRT